MKKPLARKSKPSPTPTLGEGAFFVHRHADGTTTICSCGNAPWNRVKK